MAIDFPNTPATNDTYTVGIRTWKYDGAGRWALVSSALTPDWSTIFQTMGA